MQKVLTTGRRESAKYASCEGGSQMMKTHSFIFKNANVSQRGNIYQTMGTFMERTKTR